MTKRLNRRANVDRLAKQAALSEEEDKMYWEQREKLLAEENEEGEKIEWSCPVHRAHTLHKITGEEATFPLLPSNMVLRHVSIKK